MMLHSALGTLDRWPLMRLNGPQDADGFAIRSSRHCTVSDLRSSAWSQASEVTWTLLEPVRKLGAARFRCRTGPIGDPIFRCATGTLSPPRDPFDITRPAPSEFPDGL